MRIAIDASRAFLKRRTGIEEYSYQIIRHLRRELSAERVVLYIRAGQKVDFDIPVAWRVKALWAPRFWTQLRLSWELLWNMPDVLLVLAHTVPVFHPKRTVVVVHGLEYEFCPGAYSTWERWYMRISIWISTRWASRVVCVSENTKKDVMTLYHASSDKIVVIGEGYTLPESSTLTATSEGRAMKCENAVSNNLQTPYFLFVGRIEERKNVARIIEAFERFKRETGLAHRLILVGKPGYGYELVVGRRAQSAYREDILELGYVGEGEKWEFLAHAEAFVFPSLYEGFGIPILEAQSVGAAVIASNLSSLPEVAGEGAMLVDPEDVNDIAAAMKRLVSDKTLKSAIIAKGKENVRRFSWERCAREMAEVILTP